MKDFNIAILGCGTVGGGVAKILLEMKNEIIDRSGISLNLVKIVDLFPKQASKRFSIPIEYFYGSTEDLNKEQASSYIDEIINSTKIDLIVETIGGTSNFLLDIVQRALKSKKHLVTANKALLAKNINMLSDLATENKVELGFEAAVCGAIPIIKTIKESFTGDQILSISGIFNGTSNYILSKMSNEGFSFEAALKLAQEKGYAEQDPTLDINGHDAGHKLAILIKLAFGTDVDFSKLSISGIENIALEDINFAKEIDCEVKLICYTEIKGDTVYSSVQPMMVKNSNFLSQINGATNGVRFLNKYSDEHVLIGKGAGSLETASSIVADIVFISKYTKAESKTTSLSKNNKLTSLDEILFPYIMIFETEDYPGITGAITTAIGNQGINIDSVGHNRHNTARAIFSVTTMPCTMQQIDKVIAEIKKANPDILSSQPKVIPVLY